MKILHITNWYPNKQNQQEAIWIKRLIDSLSPYYEQEVWHIEVRPSNKLKISVDETFMGARHIIIDLPIKRWFLIEVVNLLILSFYFLVRRIHKGSGVINFHIAYPQLTYWHLVSKMVKKPIVISEHWSEYHFNFGLPPEKKLERVKRIFRRQIPLITVSEALGKDIQAFCGCTQNMYTIPNIVDSELFGVQAAARRNPGSFFMLSQWKWPKNPFVVIKAFAEITKTKDCSLTIGGYGAQLEEMHHLVNHLKIQSRVNFAGRLSEPEVVEEMNHAVAFLHGSEYETFSVVCAEAICCGTPVVASNVGGIGEYINESNGILVGYNDVDHWVKALESVVGRLYAHEEIADNGRRLFSAERVGQLYYHAIHDVYHSSKTSHI